MKKPHHDRHSLNHDISKLLSSSQLQSNGHLNDSIGYLPLTLARVVAQDQEKRVQDLLSQFTASSS